MAFTRQPCRTPVSQSAPASPAPASAKPKSEAVWEDVAMVAFGNGAALALAALAPERSHEAMALFKGSADQSLWH